MFKVTVRWEQTCYYEVTITTDQPPGTQEWWREALDRNMHDHAHCYDSTDMINITFADEEIV